MTDSVDRFSNRVTNYVKFRPGYPREIVDYFKGKIGLTPYWLIADVGCGPGISSRIFLDNGNRVIGIEPNAAMRLAAEGELTASDTFTVVNGRSDGTGLPDGSVDLVIAAQAFHWFEPENTEREFRRILRPGGHVALIWNERRLDTTPFLADYEQFLLTYATDYEKVRHDAVDHRRMYNFFGKDFDSAYFENIQELDYEGLKGRMLSASYMPGADAPNFAEMDRELSGLFAKHNLNGKIRISYDTGVYHTRWR